MVTRGAVYSCLFAVACGACGEAPAVAPFPKTAEAVDFSQGAWEAAARKVEWNLERRTIRCLGTDTTVEVPPEWMSKVEIRSEGEVSIRPGSEQGVLLVRAKPGDFELGDFARDLFEGLQALGEPPPKETTISFQSTGDGQFAGALTTPPDTLAEADLAFRFRFAVVARKHGACRILALAPVPSGDAQGPSKPMLRLTESVRGSSLDKMAMLFTLRTFGQVLGLIPSS